jgi:hypothetical protein
MASADILDAAYAANISSQTSLEMLGWRDSDGDGLFDVLDVPFALEGVGRYDEAAEVYRFTGTTGVRTLPNQNSSGLQNDITINQIRQAQVSIDDGPWNVVQAFASRTYEADLDLSIPLSPGSHTIKIRTIDTRTGAMSPEFIGTTGEPSSTPTYGGVSGFVYRDDNSNGNWDFGEPPLPDWAINLVDENDQPLDLRRRIEPSQYSEGTLLNAIHTEATLSAQGGDSFGNQVTAKTTARAAAAGKVFGVRSVVQGQILDTWSSSRHLRVDFANPVSSVSLRAYGGSAGTSFGRLEAFNNEGTLIGRYTTAGLSSGQMERMNLSSVNGDIAYVVARGHLATEVVLDTLEWGPFASATSNTLGAYDIEGVPAGNYRLKIDVPQNHVVTTIGGAIATGTLAVGAAANVNFGIALGVVSWYNALQPMNVNADSEGLITAADALIVINWLNANAGRPSELPLTPTPERDGYIDVNHDGHCTAADALIVINELNLRNTAFTGGSSSSGGGSSFTAPAGSSSPEGETRTAAEYYARGPLHFLEIAGDDEDHVHEDEFGHSDHAHEAASAAATPSPSAARFAASLLVTLDGLFGERELPPRAAQAIDVAIDHLHRWTQQRQVALERVATRVEALLERVADRNELDESLDSIAGDISTAWSKLLESARRRG